MPQEFTGPVEAFTALQDMLIDGEVKFPDEIRDQLRTCLRERSPVVGVVDALEITYAREEEAPAELKEWAAGSAAMAAQFGFHGLDKEERGARMARHLRGQRLAKKDIPEKSERHLPKPEVTPIGTPGPDDDA
jgi:hypothetical protein